MDIVDISVPLDSRTTVYPGDPSPAVSWPGWTHERGDLANVGFYSGGLHHGTHVDAPWHFIRDAKRLDALPLERWVGTAQVVDLRGLGKCITADALAKAGIDPAMKRLLFRTRNGESDYWRQPFNPGFVYVEKSGAQWCVDHGIGLIGLDYLTVDPPSEPTFPSHMILLGNDTLILENINLRHVQPAIYTLYAAPIYLLSVDAGWCRAFLTR
jgi:arylformamidase